MTSLDVCNMKV